MAMFIALAPDDGLAAQPPGDLDATARVADPASPIGFRDEDEPWSGCLERP